MMNISTVQYQGISCLMHHRFDSFKYAPLYQVCLNMSIHKVIQEGGSCKMMYLTLWYMYMIQFNNEVYFFYWAEYYK